ncbi:9188_t:CDS:10 [Ambispora leptoticha]|uniref:9188_t:CDS:1 n=1 Tax=Ambispora leptoticha TaxID=144679 RepID=A0A9N9D683_9GLOM|nr:9188_t:CDS:10 [Ambispora leptoticha]
MSSEEYESPEGSPLGTSEGEAGDRTPVSEDALETEDAAPTTFPSTPYSMAPNIASSSTSISAEPPLTRRLRPQKAKYYRTYDIVPLCAAIHGCQIYALDATRNMRWVFTGGDDGYIRKYDFFGSMNGKQLLTQNQKHAQVESVQKNEEPLPPAPVVPTPVPNTPVVVSQENTNGITNGSIAEPSNSPQPEIVAEAPLPEPKLSAVYSLAVQSEAIWLLSGLESGGINLFTVRHEEGKCHHVLKEHNGPVSVLKITQDETGFISGSWDKQVLYWDLNNGQVVRRFIGHNSQITSIQFRPVLPAFSQSTRESSPESYDELFNDEDDLVNSNDVLLTTSIDGHIMIWDKRAEEPIIKTLAPERTPPWSLSACWSADGTKIYCGRRNGTVDEWDVRARAVLRVLRMPNGSGPVSCVASMPNGKQLICASTDNIRLWNLEENENSRSSVPFLIVAGHHGGTISQILIDEQCRYMITTSGNRGWEGSTTESALFYEIGPG